MVLSLSCRDSVKEKFGVDKCNEDIESVMIFNKTNNKYIAEKVEITEPAKISRICSELNSLKEVPRATINTNFGFYELEANLADDSKYNISIIYTVYDGVVIRDERGKYYKNDQLESVVLNLFQ